jgi:putative transposase
MADHLLSELALNALRMALGHRVPEQMLVHHSDRGSQYASGDYQKALKKYRMICSMSRKGNCWDNAVAESFFHTLKVELVHDLKFRTRREAMAEIFEYMEVFYDRQRIHSTLGTAHK